MADYSKNLLVTTEELKRTIEARDTSVLFQEEFFQAVLKYCNVLRRDPGALPTKDDKSLDFFVAKLISSPEVFPIVFATQNYPDREGYVAASDTLNSLQERIYEAEKERNPQVVANLQMIGEACKYPLQK